VWIAAAVAAVGLLLALPAVAGADGSASVAATGPQNESASAWFVQFAGPPTAAGGSAASVNAARTAFYSNAATMGLNVKQRRAFGTLFNGVSVTVPQSQAGDLQSVPGVVAVYPVRQFSLPPSFSVQGTPADVGSNPMIGVDPLAGGVGDDKGQGVKVAVIDSGLDYTNPDLGGCSAPGGSCRVLGGFDFVGNSYDDTSTDPTFQPVPHPSNDILPCDPNVADANVAKGDSTSDAGHGTHVAGIVGAKAATADGVTGVAPDVKFLAYKVFGCNGATDNDNIVAALERAYTDGAQVVNMSIGDDYASWPEEPTAQASDLLVSKGVVVVAAEGNAGSVNTALFSGGDPGVGNGVIGVGSFDNVKPFLQYFEYDTGAKAGFFAAAGAPNPPTSGSSALVALAATTPGSLGCLPTDFPASVSGKIVLVRRGTCTFRQKALNAQGAGAVGVVLYNNAPGFVNPTVAGTGAAITIPVVAVSDTEGADIRAAIVAGGGASTLTWTPNSDYFPNSSGGLVSSFSSWGPSAELGLKPDLSAPGGLIRSTWPMSQFGGHNVISGTSMASPHVAGAAALLLAAGRAPSQVATLLSNYAEPGAWSAAPLAGLPESPLRDGAGLIKVDRSLAATVTVTPRKISFGAGLGGAQTLTITNTGSSAATYNLAWSPAVSPVPVDSTWPNTFNFDFADETVTFSSSPVTVPAGGQATVVVNATIPASAPDGELYSGYVQLMPVDGGNAITVPYAGYKGNYQAQQVLTATPNGFPWLAKLSADGTTFTKQAAGATYTLQGNDFPFILYHLNIPARKLNVQVENADGSFVQPVFNYADKEQFLSRSSTATSFFAFAWDGTRGQDSGNNKRKVLPNGTYMLKLSILKPLGSENNPSDWETFTTPTFTIARP
jgi:subtilisin family serine protease